MLRGVRNARPTLSMTLALSSLGFFVLGWAFTTVDDLRSPYSLAAAGFCSALALTSFAFAGALLRDESIPKSFGLEKSRLGFLSVLLLVAGILAWSAFASWGIDAMSLREGSSLAEFAKPIRRAQSGPSLFLLLLALAVGAGVAEELLFRGLLLRAFAPALGVAASAVVTTLLFAAFHGDFAHSMGAGVIGAYLAGVRVATGSTGVAILCHCVNNAVSIWATARGAPSFDAVLPFAMLAAALGSWILMREWQSGAQELRSSLPSLDTPNKEGPDAARGRE